MKNFLTANDHLLYQLIRKMCQGKHWHEPTDAYVKNVRCWATRETMCKWIGFSEISVASISAAIKRLESAGLIEVVRQHTPKDPWSITLTSNSEEKYDKLLQDCISAVSATGCPETNLSSPEVPEYSTGSSETTQSHPNKKEDYILYKSAIGSFRNDLSKRVGEVEWKEVP